MCISPPFFHLILWSWKVSGKQITGKKKGDGRRSRMKTHSSRNWLLKPMQGYIFLYEKWTFSISSCPFLLSCACLLLAFQLLRTFMPHGERHLSSRLYLISLSCRHSLGLEVHLIPYTCMVAGCLSIFTSCFGYGWLQGDSTQYSSPCLQKCRHFHCDKWSIPIWSWTSLFDYQWKRF